MQISSLTKYTKSEGAKADGAGCFAGIRSRFQQAGDRSGTKIVALRALLVGSLVIAAILCSVLCNHILRQNERLLFESHYKSISAGALNGVVDSFAQMNYALQEMTTTIGHTFPKSSSWPNVAWSGFYPAATLLGKMAQLDNIIFSPIVLPEQLPSYHTFIADYYANEPYILKPVYHGPGLSVGEVWALDFKTLTQYSDTTGITPFSANQLITPAAQATFSDVLGEFILAYNVHSDPRFVRSIDAVIACAESHNFSSVAAMKCGAVTDAVQVPQPNQFEPNPVVVDYQALLTHPIFPAGNTSHLAGFVEGAMGWKGLLAKVVPTYVTGLDCVIRSRSQVFTYTVTHGVPELRGLGDFHQREYSSYGRSRSLRNERVTGDEASYVVTFYPRRELEDEYKTLLPVWGVVVLLVVFLFCSIVFLSYDWLMQRESGRKQAILDTKRRFVRFISHEIRTPLNTVRLGLNLLESELANAAKRISSTQLADLPGVMLTIIDTWTQLTADVLSNSESAVEVLDDLLNYDKIEMGNLRLELTMFNVWALVSQTVSVMQVQAQHKDIMLHLSADPRIHSEKVEEVAPGALLVVGDLSRMNQVLRNLISNALKFTPAGGDVSIAVAIVPDGMPGNLPASIMGQASELFSVNPRAGSVRISVKDSGAGLSAEQLHAICAEGVQFNANELQAGQGSGLGLFISKGIVEQHGGKLSVTSEGLGKGVTFVIDLPLFEGAFDTKPEHTQVVPFAFAVQGSPAPRGRKEALFTPEGSTRSARMHHMLVVDDSHFNRKMLTRLLTSKGYICEQAEHGEDAIKVYQDMCRRGEPPDAITMDFEMPVMNGPTATKKLRELGCTCLIVGVTGNVLPEDQAYFKNNGADDVMCKPFSIDKFEQLLHYYRSSTHAYTMLSGGSTKPLVAKHPAQQSLKIHPEENV